MLTFIKDLGMKYANKKSPSKRRRYLVLCSGCDEQHEILASQFSAGYTEFCSKCRKGKK